jgi:hypothetical protein
LTPFLVVHPDLREDFSGLRTGAEEAVVIGDAGEFKALNGFGTCSYLSRGAMLPMPAV